MIDGEFKSDTRSLASPGSHPIMQRILSSRLIFGFGAYGHSACSFRRNSRCAFSSGPISFR